VTMYTTNMCPYCMRAKRLLEKRGIAFEEINLAGEPDAREKLVERTGRLTFPQIIIGDTVVGGYDELAAADASGELQTLIAA